MSAGSSGAPLAIAVSGASGLIGSALIRSIEAEGGRALRLVRGDARPERNEIAWDPVAGSIDAARLEGIGAVVHLAGEPIAVRWTRERKARIRDSRVRGTRLLAETLASLERPPAVLVSASGIGYYGDRGDERLDEASEPGSGFLPELAREWEGAAERAVEGGVRVVQLRTGIVLARQGGALRRMLLPFRLGLGGPLGSGRQWMSWIALADHVEAIRFAIATPALRGAVNAVAPEPVTNREFSRVLGRVLRRPARMPVPATLIRLLYGEMADATVLSSQRAVPDRLLSAGFVFRYPRLDEALRAVLGRSS